jgi:hypothetical protein
MHNGQEIDMSYYDPTLFEIYIQVLRTLEERERERGRHAAFMNSDIGQTMLFIQFIIDNGAYGYVHELGNEMQAPIEEFIQFRQLNEPTGETGTLFSGPSFRTVRQFIPSAQAAYGRELADQTRRERYTAVNFFRPLIEGGIAPEGRIEKPNMKQPTDEENKTMEKNGHAQCSICFDYIEFLNNCAQCPNSHKFHISCPQTKNSPVKLCPICRNKDIQKCHNLSDRSKSKVEENVAKQRSKRETELDRRRNRQPGSQTMGGSIRRRSIKKRKSVKRRKSIKRRKSVKRRK